MAAQGKCSVRFTRRYAASAREVWCALTDPESLGRWLGRPAGVEVVVREVEPGHVLEFDWRREGEEPSLVRFELRGDGDATVLVLEHSRIDEPEGMASIARWDRALRRFEGVLSA